MLNQYITNKSKLIIGINILLKIKINCYKLIRLTNVYMINYYNPIYKYNQDNKLLHVKLIFNNMKNYCKKKT